MVAPEDPLEGSDQTTILCTTLRVDKLFRSDQFITVLKIHVYPTC